MKPAWLILVLLAISSDAARADTIAYVTLVGGSCTYPAKQMVSEIFKKVGVTIVWGSANSAGPQRIWLEIRLVEGTPDKVLPGALALSHPYSACSKRVTVFMDRIRARTRRPDHETALLAYVLVHELTHVMQGIYRHSDAGIMRARWDMGDYARIFDRRLRFMEEDLRLMRHGLAVGWCHPAGELMRPSGLQTAFRPE